jgi:hypothetical protein
MIAEFLCIGITFFGFWSLYTQISAICGANFTFLRSYSFIPLIIFAAYTVFKKITRDRPNTISDNRDTTTYTLSWLSTSVRLSIPLILVLFYVMTDSEWLFWMLSIAYLGTMCLAAAPKLSSRRKINCRLTVYDRIGLFIICAIAIFSIMGGIRPDSDDALYVSLGTYAIENPGEPLYGADNLYRSGLPLVEQHLHIIQAYEYFVAILADLFNIPMKMMYYVILPPFWALAGILAHWILLRRFLPTQSAMVGLMALIIFLLMWGDNLTTFGSFTLVRIYQGKSIYLMVGLPLIVHTALEYINQPNWQNWSLLLLTQCAAVGFTTNGLVVAPLASAFVILAGMRWSRRSIYIGVTGILSSIAIFFISIGMLYHLRQYHSPEDVDVLRVGLQAVLGEKRIYLVLFGVLMVPVLTQISHILETRWLRKYIFLTAFVLLCPLIPKLAGQEIANVFSWRIFWCWPVPFLLSLVIGTVTNSPKIRPWLKISSVILYILVFTFIGQSTLAHTNWSLTNIGQYKVLPEYEVAQHLQNLTTQSDLVLAPEEIAIYLCGFHEAPSLVTVKLTYLLKLRGVIPEGEFKERLALFSFIEGITNDISVNWFEDTLNKRGITSVAFRNRHPHALLITKSLTRLDFQVVQDKHYILAVKKR